MGLDTTHDAWHGSYSSFAKFREELAAIEGFSLDEMTGFGGSKSWAKVKSPLKPLLNHSDWNGEIQWQHCEAIANRLEEISSTINRDTEFWLYDKALTFAVGARKAFKKKQNIEFH
jgi:hypothetical protein